jgi:hypothetical protein
VLLLRDAQPRSDPWLDKVSIAKAGVGLWPAIRRTSIRTMLARAAHDVNAHLGRKTAIGRGVEAALSADQPFKSVRQLALFVGCDSATLHQGWRQCNIRRRNISLHEFLDIVFLLRGLERKVPNVGWRVLAARFGVSVGRFRRTADGLVAMSLRDLGKL